MPMQHSLTGRLDLFIHVVQSPLDPDTCMYVMNNSVAPTRPAKHFGTSTTVIRISLPLVHPPPLPLYQKILDPPLQQQHLHYPKLNTLDILYYYEGDAYPSGKPKESKLTYL